MNDSGKLEPGTTASGAKKGVVTTFLQLPLRYRIQIPVSAIVLVFASFMAIFFPTREKARALRNYEDKVSALAGTVALGTKIGLDSGDLSATQKAFEFAKDDPDVRFIVLSNNGEKLASFPEDFELTDEILSSDDFMVKRMPVDSEVMQGEIILGCTTTTIQW